VTRLLLPSVVAVAAGSTMLLSTLRWFSRASLASRIAPERVERPVTFVALIDSVATTAGARLSRALGVREELARRLERVHAPIDVGAFRTRQAAWSLAGFAAGSAGAVALSPPPALSALLVAGAPLLGFLLAEQRLALDSERWQSDLRRELPVVIEQLAMLLSSGYSLGSALTRIATRGAGNASRDLRRVCSRVQQGLPEPDALREWAGVAGLAEVDRLVAVLALERDATDLGPLLAEEARAARRDAQRQLLESLERRGQQVWIPVTVATLLPGVIFIAVPFIEALRAFSGSA
jgi:tight adherence protein C